MGKKMKFNKKIGCQELVYSIGKKEEVDMLALRIFEKKELYHFFPFYMAEFDYEKTFIYQVQEGYITLHDFFENYLRKEEVLQILLKIIQASLQVNEYLLYERGMVLDSNYMFIPADSTDIKFIYCPVKKGSIPIQWKGFLQRILCEMKFKESVNSSYLIQILNFLQRGNFCKVKFTVLINNLLFNEAASSKVGEINSISDRDLTHVSSTTMSNDRSDEVSVGSKYKRLFAKIAIRGDSNELAKNPFRQILKQKSEETVGE